MTLQEIPKPQVAGKGLCYCLLLCLRHFSATHLEKQMIPHSYALK